MDRIARVVAAAAIVAASVAAGGCGASPTRGPIPDDARDANGQVDRSRAPDFIPALGHRGEVVGYVSKHHALPDPADADLDAVPVFTEDLRTLVGHMVAGRGFVPLGSDPASVSGPPAETP